ncbi:MAG TPA: hypothetical protein VGL81_29135 [Polyangiaceae bacterium]|jgi:hypothetical protein
MKTTYGNVALVTSLAFGIVAACGNTGSNSGNGTFTGQDGSVSDSGSGSDVGSFLNDGAGGADGSPALVIDASFPCDGCGTFPGQGSPVCSPQTLGPSTLVYPPDGVLLPPNMNVLEVQWLPPQGATLFEVDFTNGITDVRVETPCNPVPAVRSAADGGIEYSGCGLTLPQQAWNDIANTNRDGDPVQVVVRAIPAGGSCVSVSPQSVNVMFAKDNLTGGIYYWQSVLYGQVAGTAGGIFYHDFGSFDPTPTPFWTAGGKQNTCVGCHTLSKDGVQMAIMQDDADADDEYGDVRPLDVNVPTRTETSAMMTVGPGFQTFTHDHAMMVATTFQAAPGGPGGPGGSVPDTSFSVWNGIGTTQITTNALASGMQGTQPNLSWDDKTLVFVAPTYGTIATQTNDVQGGLGGAGGDDHFMGGSLWMAGFNATSGAITNYQAFLTATGTQSFYYPDQSVDGNWVVFNENDDNSAANNDGDCFYNRQSVVEIMHFPPKSGDVPQKLPNLNVGTGLTNSWPRWSPALTSYHGHAVLWVTFSSNRDYGLHLKNSGFDNYYPPEGPSYDQPQPASKQNILFDAYAEPQIWMAAVVVDPNPALDSTDRSYPAFWLPFQEVSAHNHSAQWVSQVQSGGPGPDGGTGDDGGSGDGGPTCGEQGTTCGSGAVVCCTDAICCAGTCQAGCAQ